MEPEDQEPQSTVPSTLAQWTPSDFEIRNSALHMAVDIMKADGTHIGSNVLTLFGIADKIYDHMKK